MAQILDSAGRFRVTIKPYQIRSLAFGTQPLKGQAWYRYLPGQTRGYAALPMIEGFATLNPEQPTLPDRISNLVYQLSRSIRFISGWPAKDAVV